MSPADAPTKGNSLVTQDEPERFAGLESLEIEDSVGGRQPLPIIEDAYVVYLGANPKMAIAMTGKVHREEYETEQVKTGRDGKPLYLNGEPVYETGYTKAVIDDTTQGYDFSRLDVRNRVIKSRLWSGPGGQEVRGKPFRKVEHPEHLRRFMMSRNRDGIKEFKVMVGPGSRPALEAYVREKLRRLKIQKVQTEETVPTSATA